MTYVIPYHGQSGVSMKPTTVKLPHIDLTTRQRILHATLLTLVERKGTSVSLRQIAERAGVAYGNVHYHFRSKNELFLALLDDLLKPIVEERAVMMAQADIPPMHKLETLLLRNEELVRRENELRVILTFLLQSPGNLKIREKIQKMYSEWRRDIAIIVQQGIDRGDFSSRNAPGLPVLVVGLIEGITTQYLLDPQAIDLPGYFRQVRQLVYGLLDVSPP